MKSLDPSGNRIRRKETMNFLRKLAQIAVTSVVLVGFSGGANAYDCKAKPETIAAPGQNQGAAIATGRSIWTTKVKGKYGLAWSVWAIADAPQQSCQPAGNGWLCVITAKPCKYVVQ